MADLIFWLAVALCAVAQGAIVWFAIRADPSTMDSPPDVPRPRRAIELAWTLLPAAGLALILALTWRAIHAPPATASPPRSAVVPRPGGRVS